MIYFSTISLFFKSVILACGAYLIMIARISVSFNRIVQMPTRQRYLNNNVLLKSATTIENV